MSSLSDQFIQFALQHDVLRFGEFTLKSGRVSPYFFNAGLFNTGHTQLCLGRYYAQCLAQSSINFDCLFGPAYKGISLATSTAIALADQHQRDVAVTFNRKEVKAHGEGGELLGAPLADRQVVIVDDVITAGTAFRHAKALIEAQGATLVGVIVALNRQERGQGQRSAIDDIQQQDQIPVLSITNLDNILAYLSQQPASHKNIIEKIQAYREQYGS